MGTSPRVSVVIPAYNHGTYVGAAIQSVLDQTFRDFELIIIDDGSSDNTAEVILGFTDDRIRHYSQENRGLSATLNRGLELARGEFFGFLPSDDLYEPEKLALQVAVLDGDPEVGLVFGYQNLIDATGAPLRDEFVEAWFRVPYETKEEVFPALFERGFLAAPSVLMRMTCFERVGGFDESLISAQDYDLWLRVLKYYDIRLLKEPLIRYRWHGGNLTFRATERTESERAILLLKAYRDLQIEDIFPSLRTASPPDRPVRYAEAYDRLALHVERNGLPGLVPIAKIYRAEAERWRIQQSAGHPLIAVTREAASRSARGQSEKVAVMMEIRSLDTGGLEEVVFNLARSLDRSRFSVLIVCIERGGHVARKCREHGIPVEVLGEHKQREYSELLDRHSIDLVCAHYSSFGGPLASEKSIPMVSVLHNLYAWLPNDVFSEMKTNDRYVSKCVAVSDVVARYLTRRFNIPSENVTVIQNGLDVKGLAARGREPLVYSRKDFGLGEEDYVFLNVAALTGTKGHNALIRAMRDIAHEYPRMKVLCVGDTLSQAYSDIVKGRVKEWGLEGHILFSGFVERIIDLYRLADAFVLPSFIEGWSLAAGEAMFFGLPLILTRVGGAEAVVEKGDIGRIIEPSYDDLADLDHDRIWQYCIEEEPSNAGQLVEAMIDFYERRAFWRKAGKKGRAKILKYHTLAMTAKRYEELFLDEVVRAGRAKEREYLQRLATARTLEHIDQRFTETRSLIETVEGGLQALEARQQARVENLAGTVAQQLAALERAQQQRFASVEYIGRLILDRLSLAKRLKARLRALAGMVARDPARPEQAQPSPFDRPRSLGKSIRALLDRVERALKDRLPYPVRTRIKRALERLPLWSKPASHVAQGPPPVASDAARDEAYRQHLAEIRRELAESSGAGAHRLAVQHALDESRFDRIIIYPPTILWKEHLFQRPQQIFRSLAARGALCFYCSANPSLDHVDGIRPIATNLYLCSNPSLLSEPSKHHQTVLWATRPDHRAYLDLFPTARLVYEVIDELEVFPLACNAMEEDHLRLLLEADVVAATAVTLHATVGRIRPDAVLAPNAARAEDFRVEPEAEPPPDLARVVRRGGPIIGYYGALADWFDYDLLAFAAERLPQFSFVLIGPDYDRTTGRLPWGKNVFWLGPKRYDELPRYVQWFDVATIPFKVNRITSATSPIKLFEYMAAEKPIVTTALPECRRYKSVLVAETPEGFVAALDEALTRRHDPTYLGTLRNEADENSWDARVESIMSALHEAEAGPLRRLRLPSQSESFGAQAGLEPREGEAWLDADWGRANGPDILCFPINPWGFRFQRTGQLLRRFARRGHRVFHIEIGQPEAGPELHQASPRVASLEPRLYQVTLELGGGLDLYQKAFTPDVEESLLWNLDQLRQREMIGDAICLVAFPGWAPLAERLRAEFGYKIIYDCMDHHRGFGNIAEPILALEEKLAASADLVLASSMLLYREHSARNPNTVLVRNGADFDHFHADADPGALRRIPKPIIGYYGAISSWFAVEWIEAAARRRPDWSFVLIGHTFGADLGTLAGLPNVHLLGEQRYESLPGYLAGFDVCCIPFRLNELTRATDPVKFYEYLCSGKPIVSARLPELAEYAGCVHFADSPDEFVDAIAQGLAERDDRLACRRIELARRNSWEARWSDLSRAIEAIHPKVSVIIVSYNTLAQTRRCLESLLRYTGYPHYEIVVVDNGSTDGSVLFLAAAAWRCPRIRVITNAANLGFSAAANQGIAAAGGEYLVLLNSDTVVTTGWLAGLLRHLEDPQVGLVGPVTNEVANEAKVDDPYIEDLDAMRQFAWSYVQAHRGQRFEIPVPAMFCLAMRREIIDKVGLLDEGFEIGMFEDDDYALRAREAGFRVVCARDVFVHHHGRASFKVLGEGEYLRVFQKNKAYFEAKWQRSWEQHVHLR